ncbi:MAG: helix-turn-helix domain-containing protein [Ignavibacteriae bacterium]|nr:helix-turn-helix domain-containing protein [Ignavibacteria bacterium]MBI3365651.1 helix-turn-helix domain-containing protein [Ignavibacteriota bacterium]
MRKITPLDIDAMYGAILTLETLGEAKSFFRDLLTETEIKELAERWKAARMLATGASYTQIIKETGLSSTTVARVARWVKKGTGGYRLALKRTGSLKK